MSKLIVEKCKNENISPNCLIILYCLNHKITKIPLSDIEKQEAIKILNEKKLVSNNFISDKGKRLIADYNNALFILEGKGKINNKAVDDSLIEAQIISFVDDYRKLFKGYKIGSMGDRKSCVAKFMQFYKDYPNFAQPEIILKATQMYIDSINNYQYLKQADYFIYKQDVNGKKSSMLATFCDEVDMDKSGKTRSVIKMI